MIEETELPRSIIRHSRASCSDTWTVKGQSESRAGSAHGRDQDGAQRMRRGPVDSPSWAAKAERARQRLRTSSAPMAPCPTRKARP